MSMGLFTDNNYRETNPIRHLMLLVKGYWLRESSSNGRLTSTTRKPLTNSSALWKRLMKGGDANVGSDEKDTA